MTRYTFASLGDWAEKKQRKLTAVAQEATSNLMASIPVKPGITRGGTRQKGSVPRDTGQLANALQSSLNNGRPITGASEYALVIGQMKAGDVASFAWGTEYARFVHDGANGVEGTFWVQEAATRWPDIVAKVVARARSMG